MWSESDWFELLSLLVHVTVVPLREAVARKLREELNQATLVSIVAHNFCSEVSPEGGTRIVHGPLSKCFISPEKSSSLSSACEGDFLHGTSISSRDTASQTDLI